MNRIPVIDLFAGPGGLAEGFSSVLKGKTRFFDIRLSVEMDEYAHKTLELRSFCRQFPYGKLPKEYYAVLQETDMAKREKKKESLFKKYTEQYEAARQEAWHAELGGKKFPSKIVDLRIKKALNGKTKWVLIGGPPCQAFSLAGRSRVGGVHEDDHRVYLYKEYLRIIAEHQPSVFVMENVKGLLSASLNGEKIFDWILRDLQEPSSVFKRTHSAKYKVYSLVSSNIDDSKDYLIKSEKYGIPQKRHRVILLGIREDLNYIPGILTPQKKITLESVIGKLPRLRSGINRKYLSAEIIGNKKKRSYLKLDDNDELWEKYVNNFKKEITSWNGLVKYRNKKKLITPPQGTGSEFVQAAETIEKGHPLEKWFIDKKLGGVVNHQSRSHLVEDLKRYLFASIFTYTKGRFPRLQDYEKYSKDLLPDHKSAKLGKFADRVRVQLSNELATTITCHISKDGRYSILLSNQLN